MNAWQAGSWGVHCGCIRGARREQQQGSAAQCRMMGRTMMMVIDEYGDSDDDGDDDDVMVMVMVMVRVRGHR